jgi:hypothetical protein
MSLSCPKRVVILNVQALLKISKKLDRSPSADTTTTNDEEIPSRSLLSNTSIVVVDCTYSTVIVVATTNAEREGETK